MKYRNHNKSTNSLTAFMAVACVVSGILTLRGMRLLRSDGFFESWVQPTMLAGFSAFGCFISWAIIIRYYPRSSRKMKRRLLVVSLLVVAFTLMTSTFFSAFGMCADKAVMRHIAVVADEARTAMTMLYHRRKKEVELASHLSGMGDVNSSMVQREIDGGPLSGRRGSGKVSSNVNGLGDGYRNAAETLKNQSRESDRLYHRGEKLLTEIHKIISADNVPIETKSRNVEAKLASLNIILMKLHTSALPWIRDLIERLDTLYLVKGDAAMQKAVGRIRDSVKEGKEVILERLTDLEQESDFPIISFRIPDKFEAIELRWNYVVPSLMYSLATDLFAPAISLFFTAFISVFYRIKRKIGDRKGDCDHYGKTEPEHRTPTDINVAARLRKIYRDAGGKEHQSGRDNGDRERPSSPR